MSLGLSENITVEGNNQSTSNKETHILSYNDKNLEIIACCIIILAVTGKEMHGPDRVVRDITSFLKESLARLERKEEMKDGTDWRV